MFKFKITIKISAHYCKMCQPVKLREQIDSWTVYIRPIAYFTGEKQACLSVEVIGVV